jgi:hypothetical protein
MSANVILLLAWPGGHDGLTCQHNARASVHGMNLCHLAVHTLQCAWWTGLLFSHAERDIAGQVKMLSQKREESNAQYEHSVVTVRAKGLTVICEQLMTALP